MSTIRYTAGGDYDRDDSTDITPAFSPLDTLRVSQGFFAVDSGNNGVILFGTNAATDGISADFSDAGGAVSMTGGDVGDVLRSGIGDDTLNGGGGDDVLEGGAGADTFGGGSGFNTVSYEHASGGVAVDQFFGMGSGDAQGDTFTNVQAFVGSAFDDTFGVGGTYIIEGGAGADTIFNLAVIVGGPTNTVTASYAHSATGVHVDLSGNTANTGGDAEGDALTGISSVIGSRHADTLIAAATDSDLRGGGGEDTIIGGAGDDTIAVTGTWAAIDGGDGIDRLIVRNASTAAPISPAAGTLTNVEKVIIANGAVLDLSLQSAIDGSIKLNSKDGGVAGVLGTDFADRIHGGLGSDVIIGGGGRDRLSGGASSDLFGFFVTGDGGDARDVIRDFSGHNGDHDLLAVVGDQPATFVETFSGTGAL